MTQRMDRREFIVMASAALIPASAQMHQFAVPSQFETELPIPPVLLPVKSDSTIDYYEITQREGWTEIIPGMRTKIRSYNETYPGPTIKARRGRPTVVTHTNHL